MDAALHALADPIRRDILRMVRDSGSEIAPLAKAEAFLAELRAPNDAVRNAWERRLMALETEVHRVRVQGKPKRTQAMDDRKRKTG